MKKNQFEIRAKAFKEINQEALESLKRNYLSLLVDFKNKYYLLFSIKGANPKMPPGFSMEYNHILLVEQYAGVKGDVRLKVVKILLGGKEVSI